MLSSELEYCLNQAFRAARTQRHEFLTVEQLLLALLEAPKVREVDATVGGIRVIEIPESGMEVARKIYPDGYLAPAAPGPCR